MRVFTASITLRLLILLALTAAGFGFPLIPRVLAAEGPVLLKGADVVELPPLSITVKPATATRELLQGDRVGDTCRFSMSFHAKAGDTTPQLATVVAVDEESCVAEIERGEPTSLPAEREAGREGPSAGASAADVGAEGKKKNQKASMWTIWEDPAKVSVADTRTSIRSFVKKKSIDRAECRLHLDPLHQTGWQEDRNYRDFDCDWSNKKASAVADAHFFNDDFLGVICSARDRTHIYVSRNKVTATLKDTDGTVLHTWSRGGCHQLLGWGTLFEPNTFYDD